ncbi:MAG TPA: SRPBCC domain-containing protein, partial [Acidimicrobiales bacterium]|nr:SRPBCC domain-containing protein [Acidimicrobiales bacterium]
MSVDASRGTVTASVVVAVEPAAAFAVFIAEIGDWYVVDRFTVVDAERTVGVRFEPYVGGRLLEVRDAVAGTGREMGRVTAWQPGRRLEWTDGRGVEVDVRFEASGEGGTRVTLEQRGLDRLDPAEAAHVRRFGWHLLLDWF